MSVKPFTVILYSTTYVKMSEIKYILVSFNDRKNRDLKITVIDNIYVNNCVKQQITCQIKAFSQTWTIYGWK